MRLSTLLRASLLTLCTPFVGSVALAQPGTSTAPAASAPTARSAPASRPTIAALRLDPGDHVVLDGHVDEPFWSRAVPATGFRQIDPDNGAPATEATEVRIAYSADTLYLGVICHDGEPDRWLGYQRRRDEFLSSDDRFMWTIDTFQTAQSGYFFEMNPSGLMGDSLMGGGIDNRQWDGIWNARVARGAYGWSIEVAIPFRSLTFDPRAEAWGINFQRTVRRKNEDSIWTGWARNQGLRRMTNAGQVTGIREVSQGHGLDLKPYGLASAEALPARGRPDTVTTGALGVDAFYSPTPGLRSVVTVNTDFAQTEVDQRQVNLTRYSLFFPEKRDFFLDGAPYFAFGNALSGDLIVNPFFTRRIGLTAAGTPQAIRYGAKLTGQMGRQDVGLLHVRTGDDAGAAAEQFSVARVRRRLLAQSYIGALATVRDRVDGTSAARVTTGIDARLATSRFRGRQNLESTAYLLQSSGGGKVSGYASGLTVALPNDPWNISVAARSVDAAFDPAVGFLTRGGYRRYQPSVEFGPRPRGHRYVRRLAWSAALDVQTDLQDRLLSRSLDLKLLDLSLHSQDGLSVVLSQGRDRLDAPFSPTRGITLPIGATYDTTSLSVKGSTANRRVIAVSTAFDTGGYYSGTKTSAATSVTLRARPGVIVYSTVEWNRVRLAEGRFTTRLYRVVAETQFSPWMSLVNTVQYDSVSAVLGWQSRYRWIVTPGSDVYVVYTHNWLDDPLTRHLTTTDRRAATKVLYTHRF